MAQSQGGFGNLVGAKAKASMAEAAEETAAQARENPSQEAGEAPISIEEFEKLTGEETPFSQGETPNREEMLDNRVEAQEEAEEPQEEPEEEAEEIAAQSEDGDGEEEEEAPQELSMEEALEQYRKAQEPTPEQAETETEDPSRDAILAKLGELENRVRGISKPETAPGPAPEAAPEVDEITQKLEALEAMREEFPEKEADIDRMIRTLEIERATKPLQTEVAQLRSERETRQRAETARTIRRRAWSSGRERALELGGFEAELVKDVDKRGKDSIVMQRLKKGGDEEVAFYTGDPTGQRFVRLIQEVARSVELMTANLSIQKQTVESEESEPPEGVPASQVRTTGLSASPSSQGSRRGKKKPPPKTKQDSVRERMQELHKGRGRNVMNRFRVGGAQGR